MKKTIIIFGGLIVVVAVAMIGLRIYTKQFSPTDIAKLETEDLNISVTYSRPYKKEREVFGNLVPYNKVWRTGANEATILNTSQPLLIKGEILPAGTYSVFTIPGEESWVIIFNSETGQWGVNLSGEVNRDESQDVLNVEVNSHQITDVFEQFTISFERMDEEIEMVLMWDQTLVVVPIQIAN